MPEQKNKTGLLLGILLVLLLIAVGLWSTGILGSSKPTYDATVTGTVTVDGVPANQGTVTFFPVDGDLPSQGPINPDGSYKVYAGSAEPAESAEHTRASGDYIVTVFINAPANEAEAARVAEEGGAPRPGPSLVAAKYRSKGTSDLKHTVKPGANVIVLDLEGPAQDASDEADSESGAEKAVEAADAEAADAEAAGAAN